MGAEHARILREEASGGRLTAACDEDEGRARAAGAALVFRSALELIHSDKVDAVVIAAPDSTHASLVLACIQAQKPVLCEKPLAVTATEALRIIEAETARNRRLVQVGYMRRFDPPYVEMKRAADQRRIGTPVLLHNIHRNPAAPEWFQGPMSVTNAFVHEIDISRWLVGAEPVGAHVHAVRGGDPLLITMETDQGVIVSTEVFMNCRYGYHVHAQLVGTNGTIETATPVATLRNASGTHHYAFPYNWVPRFRNAYVNQMNAWLRTVQCGVPNDGANAWDGFVTTAIAEQIVAGLDVSGNVRLRTEPRPTMYLRSPRSRRPK